MKSVAVVLTLLPVFAASVATANTMNLDGTWRFKLDANDQGVKELWHRRRLDDTIALPGTTDQAGKGYALDHATMTYAKDMVYSKFPAVSKPKQVDGRGFLVREHYYIGPAWYQREIDVPENWAGKPVRFKLERVIWESRVWVDNQEVGSCDSLAAPHVYVFSALKPGKHTLTIRVDNRMIHNTGTIGHAYGPETQTRWNGIVGEISLTPLEPLWLDDVQIYPDAVMRQLRVKMRVNNATGKRASGKLALWVELAGKSDPSDRTDVTYEADQENTMVEATLPLGREATLWDEFNSALHTLFVSLDSSEPEAVRFGIRNIRRDGRNIHINGRRVFLRGALDCAVYPKTGHPPVTVEEWRRVLGVVKAYGFNHVRFHSWCPPEAAFTAGDELGVYLAPETMFWVDAWTTQTYTKPKPLGRDPKVLAFVRREIARISAAYGNHPSFAMFCIGNEFAAGQTDWEKVNQLIAEAKAADPRHIYNGSTARRRIPSDDFWVTHNSGKGARGVGPAHTDWDFQAAARATDLPLIAHETGQRPVFPDYDVFLTKFTGPLKPYNYARLCAALKEAGLGDQVRAFTEASARFQLVQYKAEHEGMLRSADYAGYQLLTLNDFTGQSEALVGILDPFWEGKGVVTADDVRAWNSETVPLARFNSFVWGEGQTFQARLEVAHYGAHDLEAGRASWRLARQDGNVVAEGRLAHGQLPTGKLWPLGAIEVPLDGFEAASALELRVQIGAHVNDWPLWVYPRNVAEVPASVHITKQFDRAARDVLADGGRVLLLTHGRSYENAAKAGFFSVFWSAGWWGNQFSSLGILCNPAHPALAEFPNAGHSDWQWQELTQGATTFDLTDSCPGLVPIVQAVTDFHHNRRLGQVFECRVGKGRLLVCGYDLESNLAERHAARQFRNSLLAFTGGAAFAPAYQVDSEDLATLFGHYELGALKAEVVSCSSEVKGYEAANVLDGNPGTMWHTAWGGNVPCFPHELVVKLPREQALTGVVLLPRQDGNRNGWIKDVEILLSDDGQSWSDPVAKTTLEPNARLQWLRFQHAGTDQGLSTQYVKVRALSGFDDQPFASLADFGVVRAE